MNTKMNTKELLGKTPAQLGHDMKWVPAMEHPEYKRMGAYWQCDNCGCWNDSPSSRQVCSNDSPGYVAKQERLAYDNGWTISEYQSPME